MLRLRNDITIFKSGSGDTTYDYVHALCILLLGAIAACAVEVLGGVLLFSQRTTTLGALLIVASMRSTPLKIEGSSASP